MKYCLVIPGLILILLSSLYFLTTMPGKSYHGSFAPLTPSEKEIAHLLHTLGQK